MKENLDLICKGAYRRKSIKGYVSRMSKADETHLWNSEVAHILEEQGFNVEEDPRSIYDPNQLFTALERYSPKYDKWIDKNDPHMKDGIDLAYKIFSKPSHLPKLKALRSEAELLKAIKPTKSSGLPNLTSKKDDFIYALDRESQVLKGIKAPTPCLAGKRTQRNNKTRLVWMYPMEMTLMEARFARPLIDMLVDRRTTMAFGLSKSTIGAFVDSICFHKGREPLALDYSKFDSSISSYFIKIAFNILATWFDEMDLKELGFEQVKKYFLETPIVMIDGNLYTGKRHGVPSGSYFTQLIDSIVNTMLIGAASSKFKWGQQWTDFLVLGDDVIMSQNDVNLDELAEFLLTFGVTLNVTKTQKKAHFLGADWKFGKPYREIQELVNMAVQPESFKVMGSTPQERRYSAKLLLCNYASTYVNGFQLISKLYRSPEDALYVNIMNEDLNSGLNKFMREYGHDTHKKSKSQSTLVHRIMS